MPPNAFDPGVDESPTVLHLVGSATSAFYYDLSLVYAREALLPSSMQHHFAAVLPNGDWQHGPSLDELSPPMALDRLLGRLGTVDLVVPYMFDPIGMTSYRSLFEDVLRIPVVGSRAEVTAVATDKMLTKQILAMAGVPVPKSFTADQQDEITYPVIVKPNSEDNSRGLTLVRDAVDLPAAVESADAFDAGVMIEQYIPGRELRVAVIDTGDELYVPAMIEYAVNSDHPIRELDHKLALGNDGNPLAQSQGDQVPTICPAVVAPSLRTNLAYQARAAHRALGCRHYSLFDFRVDPQGQPWLLEACLFWTFGRPSIISKMIVADGGDPETVGAAVWQRAMARPLDVADRDIALGAWRATTPDPLVPDPMRRPSPPKPLRPNRPQPPQPAPPVPRPLPERDPIPNPADRWDVRLSAEPTKPSHPVQPEEAPKSPPDTAAAAAERMVELTAETVAEHEADVQAAQRALEIANNEPG